jgi:type III secretion protein R
MARSRVCFCIIYGKIMTWLKYFSLLLLFSATPLWAQIAPNTQPSAAQALLQTLDVSSNPETEQGGMNPPLVTKLAVIAGLSLLPFAIMLLTSFMKIIVVLSLFRQALGVQQTPPNQVLTGISLLITLYVMFPTGVAMYDAAQDVIKNTGPVPVLSSASTVFVINVADKAKEPLRNFLQRNASGKHIQSFYQLGTRTFPEPYKTDLKQTDFIVVVPAFITSQLKSAFEVGVLIYLPFFVIDMVVSNILLAMGMMMLSPLTIALPIKLLLLVIIDGWTVLVQGLAMSFR